MPRWDVTASQVEADTFWDAKGDLAVGKSADASVNLAVGCTDGHVLQICSCEASGLKWASAPAPTGNIDNGTSNITSGGTWSVDVDATGTDGACLSAAGTMRFGDGQDLRIFHGGTNNYVTGVTGDLIIGTQGSGGGIILDSEDDTLEIKYSGAAGANFGTGGLNLVSGDVFSIACTEVLSGSALASAVKLNNANWSGTDLAVANGGTNLSVYAVGDIVYASGTTTLSKLVKPGTPAGEILTFAACASAPSWAAAAGGPCQADKCAAKCETNEDTYIPPDLMQYVPGIMNVHVRINNTGVDLAQNHNVASVCDMGTGLRNVVYSNNFIASGHIALGTIVNYLCPCECAVVHFSSFAAGSSRLYIYKNGSSADEATSSIYTGLQA